MMDRRDLIKDLIELSGLSPSHIAERSGLSKTGVLRWLKKGGSDLGENGRNKLLQELGVSRGSLSPNRVHFWKLKSCGLAPLARILSWSSTVPFEMVYLGNPNLRTMKSLSEEELFLSIYDFEKKIRILFRRKLDPLCSDSEKIDSLVASGLSKWRDSIRLDSRIFENWISGNVSVEEYDRVLGLRKQATAEGESSQEVIMENQELAKKLLKLRHQSITSAAKECCLNASAVAGWLKGVPGRLSQEKQNIFLEYLGISVGETPSPHVVHSWEAFCAEMVLRGIRPEEALNIIDSVRKGKS
ncbi:MAG: hypothetical protein ACYC9S_12230 [Leptospirales bacterium]